MIRRIVALGMVVLLCCCLAFANAEPRQSVRVAYFNMGGYFSREESGGVLSYDASYLDKISDYTGLSFSYVNCGTWAKAAQMLENHEVDLLGTVQYTSERAERFALCGQKYGITYSALAALPDSGYVFEDYDALRLAKIGCVRDRVHLDALCETLASNGVTQHMTLYDDAEALSDALESGELDAVAADVHTFKPSWSVLAKCDYAPYFFASWKGNEALTRQIDDALLKIDLYEPSFQSNLLDSFFPNLLTEPFTKEELALIDKLPPIRLGLDSETPPIAWAENGEPMGILTDVCSMLSDTTGLAFSCGIFETLTQADAAYRLVPLNATSVAASGVTEPIFNCVFYLYQRLGAHTELTADGTFTIGIPARRESSQQYLTSLYPNASFAEYDTPADCLAALERGEISFAFLSSYVANYDLVRKDIHDINAIETSATQIGIALQFGGEHADALVSIVNKGLYLLDREALDEVVRSYIVDLKPEPTLLYFLRNNLTAVLPLLIALFAVILAGTTIVMHNRSLRKQRQLLSESNRRLQEASHAKSDFLSRMSHDMRTPLNVMIGLEKLAMDDLNNPDAMRINLQKIDSSAHFLLGLINDVLDMSKIESNALELRPEPYLMSEFTQTLQTLVEPLCKEAKLEFSLRQIGAPDDCLLLDKVRFNQIFFNLLSNSVKFTPKGGHIRFLMETPDAQGSLRRFTVQDDGCGMSDEFQQHLFEPFSQERLNHSKAAGTGLGLSIVKNLVELMHGTIRVESELGKGTSFIVELNVTPCAPPIVKEAAPVLLTELRGRRVLLCEDHPMNLEIAERLLQRRDVEVDCATDGEQGVQMFSRSPVGHYDAILMDVRMPVMNGWQAARVIRAMDRADARTIPIIAMTANAYTEDVQTSLDAGMDTHLSKPIDSETLYQTLKQCIH